MPPRSMSRLSKTPKPVWLLPHPVSHCTQHNFPALLVNLIYVSNGTAIIPAHFIAAFYRGTSLPSSIFSSFLSIPATSQLLGPQSYTSMAAAIGNGNTTGSGQLFGASAFNGPSEQYMNAFKQFKNFSISSIATGKVLGTVLAFTPILESQIEAGRQRGGNAIDPPLGNYAAVQFFTEFVPGVTSVPPDIEIGRQAFFDKWVFACN